MRVQNHHRQLPEIERGAHFIVTIDGRQYEAFAGETIAAVLMANGRFPSQPANDLPGLAGFFCGIGICYGCQVLVNGRLQRACTTRVEPQMIISTQIVKEEE
ncbi:MAG: (2Fe-2S)-binding protein [Candidatus Promineifilaceae bacterium]|jgi:predicted molibdopterin-dependent oxidoreductase YjgC